MVLGASAPQRVHPDGSSIVFKSEGIDLTGIPKRILNNAAMVAVSLLSTDGSVLTTLNLVMAVDERSGCMFRTVFSPLE